MTMKGQLKGSRWKAKDLWFLLLGFVVGFFISFTITNAIQRGTVVGQSATSVTAQQTRDLPADQPPVNTGTEDQTTTAAGSLPEGHPPVSAGLTESSMSSMGMPPPLPSLEPQGGSGAKAEQAFQNIQVLKGLTPSDVEKIMEIMAVSLGVDCNYCHVPGSFESPHPKTEITRTMIRMVKSINKDFVGGKVNCYTCHRGSAKPPTQ